MGTNVMSMDAATTSKIRREVEGSSGSEGPGVGPQGGVPEEEVLREYTLDELAQYDGTHPDHGTILVGIKGLVYDVSGSHQHYGPGGAYAHFAGRDATRGLAILELRPNDTPLDLNALTSQERESLDNWERFYQDKYRVVGTFVPRCAAQPHPGAPTADGGSPEPSSVTRVCLRAVTVPVCCHGNSTSKMCCIL